MISRRKVIAVAITGLIGNSDLGSGTDEEVNSRWAV
jgi:hypothetical protein